MVRRRRARAALTTLVPAMVAGMFACAAGQASALQLPDGRTITPAGRMVSAGDFPAAALLDGTTLLVADAGETPNQLVSVDDTTLAARGWVPASILPTSTSAAPWALSGALVLSPQHDRVYLGGGGIGRIDVFSSGPQPVQLGAIDVGAYAGGVAVSQDGARLFVALPFDNSAPFGKGSKVEAIAAPAAPAAPTAAASGVPAVAVPPGVPATPVALGPLTPPSASLPASLPVPTPAGIPLQAQAAQVRATGHVGHHPLALIDGRTAAGQEFVAVANRDDGSVSILNASTLAPIGVVATGRQPAALALAPDGRDLLVVNSLDDSVVDIGTRTWRVASRVSLSGGRGLGAAPSAIALSPDGASAYVALSADNAVAVLARHGARWTVEGRIPTAWYPTSVAVDAGHGQLLVTTGKGTGLPEATPVGVPVSAAATYNPGTSGLGGNGVIEAIPLPDPAALRTYTAQVRADNVPVCSTCASRAALRGISHVVYIIRENKTYDEEFGDEPGGSRAGLLYGRSITPNSHAIANRFVLLQRFFADEEVSDTGHQAVMGGVADDWVQRFSQQAYGLDGAPRPGAELGNNDSVLWSPSDYLFDDALAHGVSFRDYGEMYRHSQAADTGAAVSPALDRHIVHDFPHFGFDPGYPDTARVAFWVSTFRRDVATHAFPSLEVIYLPEDHTTQGLPGPSVQSAQQSLPQWQVGDSDLATGRIVDALSHSPYWKSTAVFLTEDDPQSGIDHVDEHRTVGLVAGGRVRQGLRTGAHYDQAGMLRTIEEILGLPPLTEFDATARPMDDLFSTRSDLRPYSALSPHVSPLSAARIAAIHAAALRALGPNPQQDSVAPSTQRDLEWLAVRGRAFTPPATTP